MLSSNTQDTDNFAPTTPEITQAYTILHLNFPREIAGPLIVWSNR